MTSDEERYDFLTGQVYKRSDTGVVERLYTYNALGIPTTRRTARQGTVRHNAFGYNVRSELTSAELGSAPYAYAYDNIGNRKTAQEDAESITYEANELNQYTDITTGEENFIPEYDRDGKSPDGCKGDWTNREACLPRRGEPPMGRRRINQTRIRTSTGIWTADYNAQNRPVRFTRENANGTRTVITAAYDYLGRRAWKKVETIATDAATGEETVTVTLHQRYIYRGYLQVAACDLTRGGHPCLWLITWDPTQPTATRPLGIQKDGTWYAYGWDLIKNICEIFGQAGYIRSTYSYTPYGSVTEEGDVAQPLQWSSEYGDPELGLIYYNYRYYNPTDGRWDRRDILTKNNLYDFLQENPVGVIDILGAKSRPNPIPPANRPRPILRGTPKRSACDVDTGSQQASDAAESVAEVIRRLACSSGNWFGDVFFELNKVELIGKRSHFWAVPQYFRETALKKCREQAAAYTRITGICPRKACCVSSVLYEIECGEKSRVVHHEARYSPTPCNSHPPGEPMLYDPHVMRVEDYRYEM